MIPVDFDNILRDIGVEKDDFVSSLSKPSIRGLNVNTLKIKSSEIAELVPVVSTGYNDDTYIYVGDDKVGTTPLHHAGAYYMQDPSAMLPVLSIPDGDYHRILDLCSAPGGKTIQLALRYPDAEIVSNEIVPSRAKILYQNVERLGLTNVCILNNSPEELSSVYREYFDLIVVDAPCSGEGMFRKYDTAIEEWSLDKVLGCAKRQRDILTHADAMLKRGGVMLYSTCTYNLEENEKQVAYLVNTMHYEPLRPTEVAISYSTRGIDVDGVSGEYSRRRYTHIHSGEGQFFANLIKTRGGEGEIVATRPALDKKYMPALVEFAKNTTLPIETMASYLEGRIYIPAFDLPRGVKIVSGGVQVGEVKKNRLIPDHYLFSAKGECFDYVEVSEDEAYRYLRGEELYIDAPKGYGVVKYRGVVLGGYKSSDGVLKNHYPKALRNMR